MEFILDIFKPDAASPNHVAMFAKLFCAALLAQMLVSFGEQLRYFKTQPARIYGKPLLLLGKFRLPSLNVSQFAIIGVVLVLSLVFSLFGFYPRFFIFVALVCYFPYFNSILSLSYVQRKTNLLPFVMLVLVLSPALDAPLDEPATLWELVLIKIAVAQIYFSAGVQKLRKSGIRWLNGKSLQAYLLEHYLWNDRKIALVVASRISICSALSIFTLIFELTFWTVIFLPQMTFYFVAAALLFHCGTLFTMRINYLKYLSPVLMVFFTDAAFWLKKMCGL